MVQVKATSHPEARATVTALLASAAAALVWIVLAWRTPTSTYHFAPIVVALAGPFMVKQRSLRNTLSSVLPFVATTTGIAGVAVVVLGLADKLRGPTFWSDDGAIFEALTFIGLGGLVAIALLVSRGGQAGRVT